jgi:TP901 family phage tail tape measure protein
MATREAQLVARLVDQVSGPARVVAASLKAAEQQARGIRQATAAGLGSRMLTDLQRLGATGPQINQVAAAWSNYRRQAGLAADSTKWTKDQIAAVRIWERANVSAIRAVTAAGHSIHAIPGAASGISPGMAAAGGAAFGALGLGIAAPIAAGMAGRQIAQSTQRFGSVDRSMSRIGITGDASVEETRAGTIELRNLARETATLFSEAQAGLDSVTASGRSFTDAMAMMPSILRTAQAAGAANADIANTSISLLDHMKIPISELQEAQDILAKGGAAGKFELKDMARYLPSMLPAFKALGYEGQDGLRKLVAMLQTIRAGTGTAEEAAASANNIFQKMESEETATRFKKMGVDLRKEMAEARRTGEPLVDAFIRLTKTALNGDLSKLPQLFSDQEFARGVRAILAGESAMRGFTRAVADSSGTVSKALQRINTDTQASVDRMKEGADRASTAFGGLVAQIAQPGIERTAKILNDIANDLERTAEVTAREGFWGAFKKDLKESSEFAAKAADEGLQLMGFGRAPTAPERRAFDAKARRDQADAALAKIDGEIATQRGRLASIPEGTAGRGFAKRTIDGRVSALEARRTGIEEALRASDAAQVEMAELEARKRASTTRMGLMPKGQIAFNQRGLTQFGLGGFVKPGMPDYLNTGTNVPTPPPRPPELGGRSSVLRSIDDIDQMGVKAEETKTILEQLNQVVKPGVDPSAIKELDELINGVLQKLQMINGAAATAKRTAAGIVPSGASTGDRSEISRATAALERSRETNLQDRPYIG